MPGDILEESNLQEINKRLKEVTDNLKNLQKEGKLNLSVKGIPKLKTANKAIKKISEEADKLKRAKISPLADPKDIEKYNKQIEEMIKVNEKLHLKIMAINKAKENISFDRRKINAQIKALKGITNQTDDVKKAIEELKKDLKGLDFDKETIEEFEETLKNVADTSGRLGDSKAFEKLANSLGMVEEANSDTNESFKKSVGIIGFYRKQLKDATKDIREKTGADKQNVSMLAVGTVAFGYIAQAVDKYGDSLEKAIADTSHYNIEMSNLAVQAGVTSGEIAGFRDTLQLTHAEMREFAGSIKEAALIGIDTKQLEGWGKQFRETFGGDQRDRLKALIDLMKELPDLEQDLTINIETGRGADALFQLAEKGKIPDLIEMRMAGMMGGGLEALKPSKEEVEQLNAQQRMNKTLDDIEHSAVELLKTVGGTHTMLAVKLAGMAIGGVALGVTVLSGFATANALLGIIASQKSAEKVERYLGGKFTSKIKGVFSKGFSKVGGLLSKGLGKVGLGGVAKGGMAGGSTLAIGAGVAVAGTALTYFSSKLQDSAEESWRSAETQSEANYAMGTAALSAAGEIGGAALAGAAIGSIFPGIGTAIGAAIGATAGFAIALYDNNDMLQDMSDAVGDSIGVWKYAIPVVGTVFAAIDTLGAVFGSTTKAERDRERAKKRSHIAFIKEMKSEQQDRVTGLRQFQASMKRVDAQSKRLQSSFQKFEIELSKNAIQKIGMLGGTFESYSAEVKNVTDAMMTQHETAMQIVASEKARIAASKMTVQQRSIALKKIRDMELRSQIEFRKGIMDMATDLRSIPGVIKNTLKRTYTEATLDFSEAMGGALNMKRIGEVVSEGIEASSKAFMSALKKIPQGLANLQAEQFKTQEGDIRSATRVGGVAGRKARSKAGMSMIPDSIRESMVEISKQSKAYVEARKRGDVAEAKKIVDSINKTRKESRSALGVKLKDIDEDITRIMIAPSGSKARLESHRKRLSLLREEKKYLSQIHTELGNEVKFTQDNTQQLEFLVKIQGNLAELAGNVKKSMDRVLKIMDFSAEIMRAKRLVGLTQEWEDVMGDYGTTMTMIGAKQKAGMDLFRSNIKAWDDTQNIIVKRTKDIVAIDKAIMYIRESGSAKAAEQARKIAKDSKREELKRLEEELKGTEKIKNIGTRGKEQTRIKGQIDAVNEIIKNIGTMDIKKVKIMLKDMSDGIRTNMGRVVVDMMKQQSRIAKSFISMLAKVEQNIEFQVAGREIERLNAQFEILSMGGGNLSDNLANVSAVAEQTIQKLRSMAKSHEANVDVMDEAIARLFAGEKGGKSRGKIGEDVWKTLAIAQNKTVEEIKKKYKDAIPAEKLALLNKVRLQEIAKQKAAWAGLFKSMLENTNQIIEASRRTGTMVMGGAIAELGEARMQFAEITGDVERAGPALANMLKSARAELEEYDLGKIRVGIDDIFNKSMKTATTERQKQAALTVKAKGYADAETELARRRLKFIKQAGEISERQLAISNRRYDLAQEGLSIQEDVLSTIGAPFEDILAIQMKGLSIERMRLESMEQAFELARRNGASQFQLAQLEVKLEGQRAKIIKDTIGKQRSALEKLFGGVFGELKGAGGRRIGTQAQIFGRGAVVNQAGLVTRGGQSRPMGERRAQRALGFGAGMPAIGGRFGGGAARGRPGEVAAMGGGRINVGGVKVSKLQRENIKMTQEVLKKEEVLKTSEKSNVASRALASRDVRGVTGHAPFVGRTGAVQGGGRTVATGKTLDDRRFGTEQQESSREQGLRNVVEVEGEVNVISTVKIEPSKLFKTEVKEEAEKVAIVQIRKTMGGGV